MFIDGQKIAKKLSKQISKITSSIRHILSQYNEMALKNKEAGISLSNALDLNSAIWCSQLSVADTNIPIELKHSIVQSILEVRRSNEELDLVKEEMRSVINCYEQNISKIDETIALIKMKEANAVNQGSISLLIRLRWTSEMMLDKAKSVGKGKCTMNNLTSVEEWSSESSSEASDSDSVLSY